MKEKPHSSLSFSSSNQVVVLLTPPLSISCAQKHFLTKESFTHSSYHFSIIINTANQIESEGAQSLSEALKTNTTLISLNLESE
jgi:hypothetical protein